jgi:ligand-binding sensor domain-containing protein
MTLIFKTYAIVLLVISTLETGNAQFYPVFQFLTVKDGLSSNKVEAIFQDHEGFYWIATQNGLNRYDGSSFVLFKHHENDSTSLTNDYCTAITEDSNGDLWIGTIKGISRYERKTGKFKRYFVHHPKNNFEIANWIRYLAADHSGNVWIGGIGLWKYDAKTDNISYIRYNSNQPDTIADHTPIRQIVLDDQRHGVWMVTGKEITFFDQPTSTFFTINHNPAHWKIFSNSKPGELCLDKNQRVWFRNQSDELSWFDPDQNEIHTTGKKLNGRINHILADHLGRVWIYHWAEQPEIFDIKTHLTDTSFFQRHHARSLLNDHVLNVFEDHRQNFWIATNQGISIYDDQNQYYRLYTLKDGQNDGDNISIQAITQTEPGYVWLSTNKGFFHFDLNTERLERIPGVPPDAHYSALWSEGSAIWLSVGNTLYFVDGVKNKVNRYFTFPSDIFFIRKDSVNALWLGLWTGGLYRLDLTDYSQTHFSPSNSWLRTNSLVSALVNGDHLWIGYNGGFGFSKYN